MNTQNQGIAAITATVGRQLQQERLRRQSSASDERNARAQQGIAEATLKELRAHAKDPRAATLVAHVAKVVADGAEALAKYDGRIKALVEIEKAYIAAREAHDVAKSRHQLGTTDATEAMNLARQLEITGAALRARDGELYAAQQPARVPIVGLPHAAHAAREATRKLVDTVLKHEVDLSAATRRPGVDVAKHARHAGVTTEPQVAVWWILFELQSLVEYEGKKKRSADAGLFGRPVDAVDKLTIDEQLREVFSYRQKWFEETQALPEVARFRRREEIASSPSVW